MSENTIIELMPNYRLEWDGNQVVLTGKVTRKARKTGEEYEDWAILGYYGDWGAAIRSLYRRQISQCGKVSVTEFIRAITDAERNVTRAIGEAVGLPHLTPPPIPDWEQQPNGDIIAPTSST